MIWLYGIWYELHKETSLVGNPTIFEIIEIYVFNRQKRAKPQEIFHLRHVLVFTKDINCKISPRTTSNLLEFNPWVQKYLIIIVKGEKPKDYESF